MPICTKRAALPAMMAFVCALAAGPAAAQSDRSVVDDVPAANPAAAPSDAAPNNDFALGDLLMFDPANLASAKPAKPLRVPGLPAPKPLSVTRKDAPDGSGTVSLNKPLAAEWDTKVGVDIGLAANPRETYQPDKPLPGTANNPGSGAAWASIDVPGVASFGARIDQNSDQSKFGTSIKRAVPLGSKFSVTLQNSYSMTESYNTASAGPTDMPLMAAPVSTSATPAPEQVWGASQSVKLDVLPTGTSITAGLDTTSDDSVTHNKFSADQKLYGPLHVTTSVTDVGQSTSNKSITAGFKLNW
jgi:hypothetical protein